MRDDPPQPPAITHVVSELERLGYRWAHRVIGLTGFGIPQRRRRVFVVASRDGDPRDVLLAPQAVCLGQCLEMHRPPGGDVLRANAGLGTDRGTDSENDGCIDDEAHRHSKKKGNNSDAFPERACVECALDAAASPAAARAGADRHSACAHGARECYECFRTPPLVTPTRVVASIDLAEKRHGPMLDELFTLTTANGRRMCLVERDASSGAGRRGMLHVEDAERLMGLPAGWTEPVYPLNTPGKPRRTMDYKYAELVARNGRAAAESDAANSADPHGRRRRDDRANRGKRASRIRATRERVLRRHVQAVREARSRRRRAPGAMARGEADAPVRPEVRARRRRRQVRARRARPARTPPSAASSTAATDASRKPRRPRRLDSTRSPLSRTAQRRLPGVSTKTPESTKTTPSTKTPSRRRRPEKNRAVSDRYSTMRVWKQRRRRVVGRTPRTTSIRNWAGARASRSPSAGTRP